MKELRVPKQRVEVEVLLPGGGTRKVAVFLSEFASGHAGGERLSDLLNGSAAFFPAVEEGSDEIAILNRTAIAVARVASSVERDIASEFTLPTEFEVEITLVDGSSLTGLISFVMPPERSRLIDFLNDGPPFFRVLQEDCVSLVNKRHVALVAPVRK
ncbi:hypothetical protein [Vulgatibacter sp.]|uniref:hypothetical protein n=1 Tax=Vulgatibacter sp. TaxID=1971226 RepID=UPI00356969A9